MHAAALVFRALLSAAALVSIGYGCFLVFPPAAFVVTGALVWHDLRDDRP